MKQKTIRTLCAIILCITTLLGAQIVAPFSAYAAEQSTVYSIATDIINWKKSTVGSNADGYLMNDGFLSLAGTTPGDWYPIGLGYIVAPFDFELNEANLSDMADTYGYNSADEFKEKISMAYVLDYVLKTNGLEMDYQGSLESTYNGFYMSSMSGIADTTVAVPDELYAKLEENGYFLDEGV